VTGSLRSHTTSTKRNTENSEGIVGNLLLDIVAIALAISQVCDTWFNGTIFAEARAYLEVWQGVEPVSRRDKVWQFFAELLSCPFCLSHHVMFVLVSVCWLPTFLESCAAWGVLTMLPVYGLAALRVSGILNKTILD